MLLFLAEVLKTILLAQDLLCNFHLKSGVPKLCLKLDLANAFDSVKWGFLEAAFHSLSFHNISLPSSCVKKLSFSILINGQAVGYSKSTRKLRQVCPLSPYFHTCHGVFLCYDEYMCGLYAYTNSTYKILYGDFTSYVCR